VRGASAGAHHLALDRHPARVVLMRRNLRHARGIAVGDAATPPLRPASCAAVLLDAPCSGTGTLRRHPEIRWRLQAADLAGLAAVQRRLAAAAAALLAPGGVLIYATCSLEPEENAAVVAGLELEPTPVAPLLPDAVLRIELPGGVVIPPTAHGDGFTVHALRRPAIRAVGPCTFGRAAQRGGRMAGKTELVERIAFETGMPRPRSPRRRGHVRRSRGVAAQGDRVSLPGFGSSTPPIGPAGRCATPAPARCCRWRRRAPSGSAPARS
jgi:hypothetical protein